MGDGTGALCAVLGALGAVGAAEALDCAIGPPARFQQQMHPLLLIGGIARRMIGPPRPAGIRKNEDALAASHEGRGLCVAGPGRAGLELLPAIPCRDQALGPARYFGHAVVPKMLEDAIERLCFLAKVGAGLRDLDAGQGQPHAEVKRRLAGG